MKMGRKQRGTLLTTPTVADGIERLSSEELWSWYLGRSCMALLEEVSAPPKTVFLVTLCWSPLIINADVFQATFSSMTPPLTCDW